MNILIDSNIFIPLEPNSETDIEPNTHLINEFYKKAKELNYHIFLLDTQKKDIESDKNVKRKNARLLAFEKYEPIENVKITKTIQNAFPNINPSSHDAVDISLLNVVCADIVNILVTNDEGIHKKAKKIGIEDKIYDLADALNFVNGQLPKTLKTNEHPIIKAEKCYNIDINNSFFDSLRLDYKDFNNWFIEKCKRTQRDCLLISDKNDNIVGICIYKFEPESSGLYGMTGDILKICTFKLCSSGKKLGELLLKNLFENCYKTNVDYIYVTAIEGKYICNFFEKFGFENRGIADKYDKPEIVFVKSLKPTTSEKFEPLEYHIKYGTKYFDTTQNAFLIPIKKDFHRMLFPETTFQGDLFPESFYVNSYSNAITKAYICGSNSTLLKCGDILFFYQSHNEKTIQVCGIVEKLLRSKNVEEILTVTGKRTIYDQAEIEKMCENGGKKLIILFRQAENLKQKIKFDDLLKCDLVKGVPQTITKITEDAKQCILKQKIF